MKQQQLPPHVRVGAGVIVFRDGKVLAGMRKNAHGDRTWSLPGGNLEYGETASQCAKREVFEETGITIKNVKQVAVTEDFFASEGKHYITLWMLSSYASGTLHIAEPDKFIRVDWFAWEKIPTPHFLPLANLRKSKFSLSTLV